MVNESTTRHSILEAVQKPPGCCAICRGITGPFIDCRVSVLGFGALVYCSTCVNEMYTVLNGTPEPVVAYVDRVVNMEEVNAALALANADLLSATTHLAGIHSLESVPFDGDAATDSNGSAEGDDEGSQRVTSDSEQADSANVDKGPADVSDGRKQYGPVPKGR